MLKRRWQLCSQNALDIITPCHSSGNLLFRKPTHIVHVFVDLTLDKFVHGQPAHIIQDARELVNVFQAKHFGLVVVGEQLGVPAPVNHRVQCFFGGIIAEGAERQDKKRPLPGQDDADDKSCHGTSDSSEEELFADAFAPKVIFEKKGNKKEKREGPLQLIPMTKRIMAFHPHNPFVPPHMPRVAWKRWLGEMFEPKVVKILEGMGLDLPNVFYSLGSGTVANRHPEVEEVLKHALCKEVLETVDYDNIDQLLQSAKWLTGICHGSTLRALAEPILMDKQKRPVKLEAAVPEKLEGIIAKAARATWVHRKARKKTSSLLKIDWRSRVVQLAVDAEMPIVQALSRALNKDAFAYRVCGSYREKTLKKNWSNASKVAAWASEIWGKSWPQCHEDLVSYLEELAAQPCAPSLPARVISAVNFIETLGGVPEADRVYQNIFVNRAVQSIYLELKEKKGGSTFRKKAKQLPLALLMSFEVMVLGVSLPAFVRLSAWTRCLRHWLALRWDDTLYMPPHDAEFESGILTVIIIQTDHWGREESRKAEGMGVD